MVGAGNDALHPSEFRGEFDDFRGQPPPKGNEHLGIRDQWNSGIPILGTGEPDVRKTGLQISYILFKFVIDD
jgi:hypothetical protein